MSKTCKKTENRLEMVFHDQRPKRMCFQIVCSQNSCHNKIRFITKVPNTQQKPLLEEN